VLGQNSFVDSLSKMNKDFIIYQETCVDCYFENSFSQENKIDLDTYLYWRQDNITYVKHFNKMGQSSTIKLKRKFEDPFEFLLNHQNIKNDTILFPVGEKIDDSTWSLLDKRSFVDYKIIFHQLKDTIYMKDYYFKAPDDLSDFIISKDPVEQENQYILYLNEQSSIKKLLDILQEINFYQERKLRPLNETIE
jgi:hypothetical protein